MDTSTVVPNPPKLNDPHTVRKVIEAIAGGASDALAARTAGITTKTLSRHRARDQPFSGLYQAADIARRVVRGEPPRLEVPAAVAVVPPVVTRDEPTPPAAVTPYEAETLALGATFVEDLIRDVPVPPPLLVPAGRAPVVIVPELVDEPDPDPGPLSSPHCHEAVAVAIEAVERHLPTGQVNPGSTWTLGFRAVVAKNQRLIDEGSAPPGVRAEALRTINKLYLGPVLEALMANIVGSVAMEPTEPQGNGARGLGPNPTADLMDAVAGPVPTGEG